MSKTEFLVCLQKPILPTVFTISGHNQSMRPVLGQKPWRYPWLLHGTSNLIVDLVDSVVYNQNPTSFYYLQCYLGQIPQSPIWIILIATSASSLKFLNIAARATLWPKTFQKCQRFHNHLWRPVRYVLLICWPHLLLRAPPLLCSSHNTYLFQETGLHCYHLRAFTLAVLSGMLFL